MPMPNMRRVLDGLKSCWRTFEGRKEIFVSFIALLVSKAMLWNGIVFFLGNAIYDLDFAINVEYILLLR